MILKKCWKTFIRVIKTSAINPHILILKDNKCFFSRNGYYSILKEKEKSICGFTYPLREVQGWRFALLTYQPWYYDEER